MHRDRGPRLGVLLARVGDYRFEPGALGWLGVIAAAGRWRTPTLRAWLVDWRGDAHEITI